MTLLEMRIVGYVLVVALVRGGCRRCLSRNVCGDLLVEDILVGDVLV